MSTITDHPANTGVIRSLARKTGGAVSVVAADVRDPYLGCGSHPEIVERVWDQLGHGLPPQSRRILCGTPVLVHPDMGLILAVCSGTSYGLRIPADAVPVALRAGCTTSHRWGNGETTDLAVEFGPDWVFGCWAKDELTWCRSVGDAPVPPA